MKFLRTKSAFRRMFICGAIVGATLCCSACGDDDPRCCEPHAEWEYETVPPKDADKKADAKKSADTGDQQTDTGK